MSVDIEEFPLERIELNIEMTHHPDLMRELAEIITASQDRSFENILAGVAAYCEIALDGYYSEEEINKLCTILTDRLREKRSAIITIH